MRDLNFTNCSVAEDFFNVTSNTNEMIRNESTAAVVGTNVVALLISIFSVFLSYHFSGRNNPAVNTELFKRIVVLRILILGIIVLILPILIVLLIPALCYKLLCSVIIKRKDKQFVGFLDSFDVFWNLEGDSVINILGIIESASAEALFENMKLKLQKLAFDDTINKIFNRRNEEYGFYYWRRYSLIDMSEYIEIIELPEKYELGVKDLEDIMTDLTNKCLPYNDEGLFKILITKQRIGNYNNERGEYGIIFRIHHSVGDGVALIQFLCESLADKTDTPLVNTTNNIPKSHNQNNPCDIIDMIKKLCDIPFCVVDLVLRKPDKNTLHGPTLMGLKNFKWTESDENLLKMVKEIKDNVDQFTFSDVMMMALSAGLNNYFYKTVAHVPEDVAVVMPVRIPPQPSMKKNRNILSNDFSVSIFDLPVKGHRKLETMKTQFIKFRKSNEYLANHYFIKLASILPKQILGPMFYSSQATAVFSNFPGPDRLTICGGNVLKKLVFFVPHKGITGVGVTAFCYGGVLRLAVSADKALVPKSDHLDYILEGMVDEIKRLHLLYVKK